MLVMTDRFGLKRSIQRKRVADAEVARMRRVTQPVDDPEIEILDRAPARRGNVADVGRIGGIRDAIAERRDVAVLHDEGRQRHRPARALDRLALAGLDRMAVEDRRIVAAGRRLEAVAEALA